MADATFKRTWRALGMVALAGALFTGPVHAQTEEEIAGARAAATEGAKAFTDERWVEALDLFARAESLVHAPPHLLYMARANAKLGKLVAARELYNKIIRESLGSGAPPAFVDAQDSARKEIEEVQPRLAKLTVTVRAPEGVTPTVTMDGETVATALIGVPRPVDPGEHVIEATAEGHLAVQEKASLEEGATASLVLELEPDPNYQPPGDPAAAAAAPAEAAPAAPATPQDAGMTSSAGSGLATPAYIALGVGAVGLGAGVVFTLQSASKRSDADDKFAQCRGNGVDGECKQSDPLSAEIGKLDDEAGSAKTMAIVGYALGGLGVAAGVTLLVLDSTSESSASEPRIVPFVGYRSVGVTGTF